MTLAEELCLVYSRLNLKPTFPQDRSSAQKKTEALLSRLRNPSKARVVETWAPTVRPVSVKHFRTPPQGFPEGEDPSIESTHAQGPRKPLSGSGAAFKCFLKI